MEWRTQDGRFVIDVGAVAYVLRDGECLAFVGEDGYCIVDERATEAEAEAAYTQILAARNGHALSPHLVH